MEIKDRMESRVLKEREGRLEQKVMPVPMVLMVKMVSPALMAILVRKVRPVIKVSRGLRENEDQLEIMAKMAYLVATD